jgi:hypothetical protein
MFARILATIAFLAGSASADDMHVTAQQLRDQGAVEVASGKLFQERRYICLPWRGDPGCGEPETILGTFQRLKLYGDEYVCISFHDWECTKAK